MLNVITRLLGAILGRDHSLGTPPRRILVIKLVGLGSVVHSSLLLRALKEKYPQAPLTFLCFREALPLVERVADVDEIITLDDSSYLRLLGSVLRFVVRSWRRRPDLVVDLEVYSKFSTILSTLTCARDRAGYYVITTLFRHRLYTHLVSYNRMKHVQEAYRQLGRVLGADPAVGEPVAPRISDAERETARRLLAEWGQGDRKLLVVNVNAGELCLERRWESEKFARVIGEFAARDDVLVVMTGSPDEAEYTESVRELVPDDRREGVVNAAGRASFGEFLALLDSADVVLTNDSGPLHLAAAVGTSTVSLWGPGLPETYRPLSGEHRVIWKSLYCSPCLYWVDEPPCAGDNACMKRIGWGEVVEEVAGLLRISLGELMTAADEPEPHAETETIAGYVVRKSVLRRETRGPTEP